MKFFGYKTKTMKQLLLSKEFKIETQYGGSFSKGKAKIARPFNSKKPLHTVLKLNPSYSFYKKENKKIARGLVNKYAKRSALKLYQTSFNSSHIHLLAKAETQKNFQNFLRVVSGVIARKITGCEKGKPLNGKFWEVIVWSKIINWGKHFLSTCRYILQNELECEGVIPYQKRKIHCEIKLIQS